MGSKSSKKSAPSSSNGPKLKAGSKAAGQTTDYELKVLTIGDSGVGKSSLILRYVDNTFQETFISSIGDQKSRIIQIGSAERSVLFRIWDTAGQERFRTITSSYYRGAHAILVCYDITNPETFNNLQKWLQEIDRYATENVVKVVVACKCDLEYERKVREEEAVEFCDTLNLMHYNTSSKSTDGVELLFTRMAEKVIEEVEK